MMMGCNMIKIVAAKNKTLKSNYVAVTTLQKQMKRKCMAV